MENMSQENQDTNVIPSKYNVLKILIFVVIFISLLFFIVKFFLPLNTKPIIKNTLPDNYHYKVLPVNTFPQGFTPKMILVPNTIIEQKRAEDTIAGDGKRLKIVELVYKNIDVATLAKDLEENFKTGKWILNPKQNKEIPVIRVFNKAFEIATITIMKINDKDSFVNITISTK